MTLVIKLETSNAVPDLLLDVITWFDWQLDLIYSDHIEMYAKIKNNSESPWNYNFKMKN